MTEIQAKINEALEIYLERDSYLSEDLQSAIKEHYGDEVANWVSEIYNEALDYPDQRGITNMNEGCAAVDQFLISKYPWLSAEARLKLGLRFMRANM